MGTLFGLLAIVGLIFGIPISLYKSGRKITSERVVIVIGLVPFMARAFVQIFMLGKGKNEKEILTET